MIAASRGLKPKKPASKHLHVVERRAAPARSAGRASSAGDHAGGQQLVVAEARGSTRRRRAGCARTASASARAGNAAGHADDRRCRCRLHVVRRSRSSDRSSLLAPSPAGDVRGRRCSAARVPRLRARSLPCSRSPPRRRPPPRCAASARDGREAEQVGERDGAVEHRSRSRRCTCTTSSEWPPRSKKLSSTPTCRQLQQRRARRRRSSASRSLAGATLDRRRRGLRRSAASGSALAVDLAVGRQRQRGRASRRATAP